MDAIRKSRYPYEPRRKPQDCLYGVWDNRLGCWAELPDFSLAEAESRAVAMIEAYAGGYADAVIAEARRYAAWRRGEREKS